MYISHIHTFYFIRTVFIRKLRLRFAPKLKKMYGLKLEHPQAQPNCTRSYKKKECSPPFYPRCTSTGPAQVPLLSCRRNISFPAHSYPLKRQKFYYLAVIIALFTVTFAHLHYNVFERGCEAISGNLQFLPEIASHPRSNTL